ncbi:MAG: FlgD immunoglobulin-like domain containing protein [Candidatus Krumholzibacteriia bacterium]
MRRLTNENRWAHDLGSILISLGVFGLVLTFWTAEAGARNPYRRAFFNVYPSVTGSVLDDVPSSSGHCGACHFDFNGGGQRNAYGLRVEVQLGSYSSTEDAIFSLHDEDSDNDGFTNGVEITDTTNFGNTPTFPGLRASNVGQAVNVALVDIEDHLTPAGGSDVDPPVVAVLAPSGGASFTAETEQLVQWTASDPSGIASVDILLSTDGGVSYRPVARNLPGAATSYDWFVPLRPGPQTVLKVVARDGAGNPGDAVSGAFTIVHSGRGLVATTMRDFDLPGSQPLEAGILEHPDDCATCHGGYDALVEPHRNWQGSMMAHAMRDPLYLATVAVAEQDAPGVGDLCLRCHTPGGWLEGRSTDTSGGQLIAKDRESVQCDFCHRMVDPIYTAGVSPVEDADILAALAEVPLAPANGQFVTDPDPVRRGPYEDALAAHQFLASPFHRESDLCGTCHDVSNPVFVRGAGEHEYVVADLDAPHPDNDLRNMFPVERTYSEWSHSAYAAGGVYAPQFAGDRPDGMVSSCQDCHMRDVTGAGAELGPVRSDLPLHDLTGGNHFIPDILADLYPGEVDAVALAEGKVRAEAMLSLAATMELGQESSGAGGATIAVTVVNETGHKLPSGYPEGRRIWLNVRAFDGGNALVYESGAYDAATGFLTHDPDLKIYHAEPGISTRLASATGLTAGPSFHFALNDSIYLDNRIPPRGFTNAAFAAVQAAPIAHSYADGQYADTTRYTLPMTAARAEVVLYYQSTSLEYVTFLRDENTTTDHGQVLYDAWVGQGRCAPVVMTSADLALDVTAVGPGDVPAATYLAQNAPNPFNPSTTLRFGLRDAGPVQVRIFDERGRLVRTLVDETRTAGMHTVVWDGRDHGGRRVASGVYHGVLRADGRELTRKMTLVK